MTKPKISHPMTDVKIPSTDNSIRMRPMLVRDEKLLLMAKTTNNVSDILGSIKQVVTNCIEGTFNVDSLAIFDLEFLFLKLRAISIDNIANITITDPEDNLQYKFKVDLSKVTIKKDENEVKDIPCGEYLIKMKYPSASLYANPDFVSNEVDAMDRLLVKCIESVWDKDKKFEMTDEELIEFINDLPIPVYEKINNFFQTMPKMNYVIKYKNEKGKDQELVLSSLEDFFIFV